MSIKLRFGSRGEVGRKDLVFLEVKMPREGEETPEAMASFLAGLSRLLRGGTLARLLGGHVPSISLEIVGFDQGIHFYLAMPQAEQGYVEGQLLSQYPKALMLPSPDYLPTFFTQPVSFGQLTLGAPAYFPLRTYVDFKDVDPLAGVIGVFSKAGEGERLATQLVLSKAGSGWANAGRRYLAGRVDSEGTVIKPENGAVVEGKIGQPAYEVCLRILASAPTSSASSNLVSRLASSYGAFTNGQGNYLKFSSPKFWQKKKFLEAIVTRKHAFCPKNHAFSNGEIATIYHFPGLNLSLTGISWGANVSSEPPENLPTILSPEKEEINFIGRTQFKNRLTSFGIKFKDRRRHLYLVGKTGTGKSTVLANMAINDIRGKQGLAVVDPHGDLCETLLEYIPSHRINDVIYFNPADTERPVALNAFSMRDPSQKDLIASGILSIFIKLYGFSWGPRLEYILRNTLLSLLDYPNATFVEVPRMLTDKGFRSKVVEKITDPVLKNFWVQEFDRMDPRQHSEAVAPILNKVGQFLSAQTMRNVIGRPNSTIDLEDIMNSGKILLVNLSQGRIGEDSAALLGAMVITKLQLAAMSRVDVAEEARRDFFLYVDEFQNFATTSFIKIMSEARKYRLNLTLANQYLAQLPEEVRDSVFGNAGSLVSFAVGAEDGEFLSKQFGEVYSQADLTGLSNYQAIIKLSIDNLATRPFFGYTFPLPDCRTQNKEKVIRISRERYGVKA